jgi:hypothetical protein
VPVCGVDLFVVIFMDFRKEIFMHPHMALNIDEVIELTTLKKKTTAIIPTGPASINCLLWSVFSLLLRSTPNGLLEHFIVCINGPDKRTGSPALQDKKQEFLEELRRLKWYHANDPDNRKDMPITVIRAWSRVGYAEAVEMAVPWIHTDSYTCLHDDIIINKADWEQEVEDKFYSDLSSNIIAYGSKELLFAHCDHVIAHGLYMLRLPNMYSHFLVCNRKLMRKIGGNFCMYNLGSVDNPIQFDLEEETGSLENFLNFWREKGLLNHPPQTTELYNFINMGFGSWVYYNACQAGYNFVPLNPKIVTHFGAMSLSTDQERPVRLEGKRATILELEAEIMAHPEYSQLYMKYKNQS